MATNEIWIHDCDYQSLMKRQNYQVWLEQIICYMEARVGQSSRMRMFAYEQGAHSVIALDILGNQMGQDMAITIQVSPDTAMLPLPVNGQLDMVLPSVVSILELASYLTNCLWKVENPTRRLEISPWDERPAVQHELRS